MTSHTEEENTEVNAGEATESATNASNEDLADAASEILTVGQALWAQSEAFLESLLRPWNAYQIALALGMFLLAQGFRLWLGPKIREWMAGRKGWPSWRMRILVVIHQRLRAIFFVILLWVAVYVLRETTWPSRSYLLSIIAGLATAWLLVAFATRRSAQPPARSSI